MNTVTDAVENGTERAESLRWALSDRELPVKWLNLAAGLGEDYPRPCLGSELRPAEVDDLASFMTRECARIEVLDGPYSSDPTIGIPEPVLDAYRQYRPTPLCRACGFERHLQYNGRILFKREDMNPAGSHKPNTALPQAFYAAEQGLAGLVTDTGAGQWGTALAMASATYGIGCTVFMTRNSFDDKPYRRYMMQLAGGRVIASPSNITEHGRSLLQQAPQHQGSLGIGMGEAIEMVRGNDTTRLALGCMSYYAAMHQTVVGQELARQLELADSRPAVLIGCVGGGTNLFGFASPFLQNKLAGKPAPRIIAAESANVPVFTKGRYEYDHADAFGLTPRVLMYTLGHQFVPPRIHAGGLRYHGKSAILSLMVLRGFVEAVAIDQTRAFEAGRQFFHCEGILPAPETCHAIAAVIDLVNQARHAGRSDDIVFCLSGNGYLDLTGYAMHFGFTSKET